MSVIVGIPAVLLLLTQAAGTGPLSETGAMGLLFAGVAGLFLAGSNFSSQRAVAATTLPRWNARFYPALAFLLALGLAQAGQAAPLAAFGDYTGENHSGEAHNKETLNNIILSNANLDAIALTKSILSNAVATYANFNQADLVKTDFTGADLTGSIFTEVKANKAIFDGAILDGVDFSLADLDKASFVGASLLGADLSNLQNANKVDWTGAFYDAFTLLDPGIDTSVMIFVAEPGSAFLLAMGLVGVAAYRRRTAASAG